MTLVVLYRFTNEYNQTTFDIFSLTLILFSFK